MRGFFHCRGLSSATAAQKLRRPVVDERLLTGRRSRKAIMKRFQDKSSPPRQRNPRNATDGSRALLGGIRRHQARKVKARAEWLIKVHKALRQHARKDRVRLHR